MQPVIHVLDPVAREFLNVNCVPELLSGDNIFTEGPVWDAGNEWYLYSDIPQNRICRIIPGKEKEVYIEKSGCLYPDDRLKADMIGSNALAIYEKNSLLVCQHGNHGIAIFKENRLESFIARYNDKPFNSPNDLIVHKDGRIFFSDPPYGLKEGKLNPEYFQPLAGIYCWENGKIDLINTDYQYPNGVCLSPDQSKLYACSNKPFERFVTVFDTKTLSSEVLCSENGDGIETDTLGNIYLCSNEGIVIVNEKGKRLALVTFPAIPANLCWGGKNGKDLFVTARQNIFLFKSFFVF